MSEDEKIQELIEKYGGYFENSNADVCHTYKGIWFFFRFDPKYKNFECFIQFETAGQLKNIILGEIVDDINTLMVDYATAKEYASHLRRKVIRVHWQIPAKIRIYVNL